MFGIRNTLSLMGLGPCKTFGVWQNWSTLWSCTTLALPLLKMWVSCRKTTWVFSSYATILVNIAWNSTNRIHQTDVTQICDGYWNYSWYAWTCSNFCWSGWELEQDIYRGRSSRGALAPLQTKAGGRFFLSALFPVSPGAASRARNKKVTHKLV